MLHKIGIFGSVISGIKGPVIDAVSALITIIGAETSAAVFLPGIGGIQVPAVFKECFSDKAAVIGGIAPCPVFQKGIVTRS
ncbi:hypothetical protein D3C87_1955800 [compost metagenome]